MLGGRHLVDDFGADSHGFSLSPGGRAGREGNTCISTWTRVCRIYEEIWYVFPEDGMRIKGHRGVQTNGISSVSSVDGTRRRGALGRAHMLLTEANISMSG